MSANVQCVCDAPAPIDVHQSAHQQPSFLRLVRHDAFRRRSSSEARFNARNGARRHAINKSKHQRSKSEIIGSFCSFESVTSDAIDFFVAVAAVASKFRRNVSRNLVFEADNRKNEGRCAKPHTRCPAQISKQQSARHAVAARKNVAAYEKAARRDGTMRDTQPMKPLNGHQSACKNVQCGVCVDLKAFLVATISASGKGPYGWKRSAHRFVKRHEKRRPTKHENRSVKRRKISQKARPRRTCQLCAACNVTMMSKLQMRFFIVKIEKRSANEAAKYKKFNRRKNFGVHVTNRTIFGNAVT